MEFYTVRNTAILALTQIGVITIGVLAAGATIKWYDSAMMLRPSSATTLAAECGHWLLVVPLLWAAVALWRLNRAKADENPELLVLLTGFVLLLVQLAGVWLAAAGPFLRTMCGLSLGP